MSVAHILFAFVSLSFVAISSANDSPLVAYSEDAACQILKVAVAKARLSTAQPDPDWYCDPSGDNQQYYILALRSSRSRPDMEGAIYSNLMGWFAVKKGSDQVFIWDINEYRVTPLE
jgi:hypothetical protein